MTNNVYSFQIIGGNVNVSKMAGVHTNNEVISPCTARSVSAVLRNEAMTGCLEAREAGHCGDGEVDRARGEQCDCGDQVSKELEGSVIKHHKLRGT